MSLSDLFVKAAAVAMLLCSLPAQPAKAQADAGEVYSTVLNDRTEVRCKSMTQATMTYVRSVKVLNRKGLEAAQFYCGGDRFNSLQSFSGEIRTASGSVARKIKKSDLQRTEYSSSNLGDDNYMYYYECDFPSFPFTITYEWEVRNNNGLAFYPTFSPQRAYRQSVEKASYRMEQAPGQTCRYHLVQAEGGKIQVNERAGAAGEQIVELTAQNLPSIPREPYAPPLSTLTPYAYFAPSVFKFDKSEGSMENWKSFGKWQLGLLEGRDVLPEAARAKLHQLVSGCTTDREKVKAVYDYLGQTTRYVSIQLGIGGWQPMAAADVCRMGFGDCKGLSNYTRAMLKELGIPSTYTVISTVNERLLPDFASIAQMNHVILQVPLPADTLWLECTNPSFPFGYVHESIAGHDALLIEPDGGRLCTLPTYPDSLNTQVNQVLVTLAPDASARMEVTQASRLFQYQEAAGIRYLKPDKQKDKLRDGIDLSQADIQSLHFSEQKSAHPTSIISYTATTNLYGQKTGNRLFIPVNAYRKTFSVPADTRRLLPIHIGYGYCDTDSICLRMPQGYTIEGIPHVTDLDSKFGTFHSEVKVEDGEIRIVQRLFLRKGTYPPEEYAAFVDFRKQVNSQYRGRLVLKKVALLSLHL
ncbi:MAG: DUF3857 domain-containing protein [Mediterranea sp.]|jgi:transglutaminase-like putative cysteine protease|nr:DUF3857 domain-containing protein [Mediterranea sp.]